MTFKLFQIHYEKFVPHSKSLTSLFRSYCISLLKILFALCAAVMLNFKIFRNEIKNKTFLILAYREKIYIYTFYIKYIGYLKTRVFILSMKFSIKTLNNSPFSLIACRSYPLLVFSLNKRRKNWNLEIFRFQFLMNSQVFLWLEYDLTFYGWTNGGLTYYTLTLKPAQRSAYEYNFAINVAQLASRWRKTKAK